MSDEEENVDEDEEDGEEGEGIQGEQGPSVGQHGQKKARLDEAEADETVKRKDVEKAGKNDEFDELLESIKHTLMDLEHLDNESIKDLDIPTRDMALLDFGKGCISSVKSYSKYTAESTTSLLLAFYIFYTKCLEAGDAETQNMLAQCKFP